MRLDDLYKMTAFIYQDANTTRSKEATYLHFVEVCAMLTQLDRKKARQGRRDFCDLQDARLVFSTSGKDGHLKRRGTHIP